MPDYDALLDEGIKAFIRETARHYPPDAASLDIAGQRAVYDRMAAAFRAPRPSGVRVEDWPIGGVPARIYESGPGGGAVLYLHGGGFVVGGLESHDDVCAEICAGTGLRVVSADYRLAPEHPHPAAYLDALAAVRAAFAAFGAPLILAGDSAGAALAASVAHALRGSDARVAGQVLIYPGLGGDADRGSYIEHAEAPMLTRADVLFYGRIRFAGEAPERDPTAAALHDEDFSGLPPTLIFSAECDPLADDGREYRDRIRAAGGAADWRLDRGLVHGWLRARHMSPRAGAAFARIVEGVGRLAAG
ncbi:MAG: alpha/beta hydrolase [Pikeienuella sp.]|uniref:alpha/beta hydrolase n=1 Tax=Pikeienuella sp. TaxID=2831957 RepID=UPI00391B3E54